MRFDIYTMGFQRDLIVRSYGDPREKGSLHGFVYVFLKISIKSFSLGFILF